MSLLSLFAVGVCHSFSTILPVPPTVRHSITQLSVFEFFSDRAKEGVEQLQNIAEKGIVRGFADAAQYTKDTNERVGEALAKSRARFVGDLEGLFSGSGGDDLIDELEDILLQADLGLTTTDEILSDVRVTGGVKKKDELLEIIRARLLKVFECQQVEGSESVQGSNRLLNFAAPGELTVFFVMGANGMGKTTTIGKLAKRLKVEGGQKVLLSACDTFRAGAVDQLRVWSERAEVDFYGPKSESAAPSTILYESLDKAEKEGYDTLLVDTSGRLSNNVALTAELLKMKKIIQKRLGGGKDAPNLSVPHETILVVDAAQGLVALESAKKWNEDVGLTSLVLTKLDGSARGGSVVAVCRELGIPVKLVGVGEKIDDLKDFSSQAFVDGLLGGNGDKDKSEGKLRMKGVEQRR